MKLLHPAAASSIILNRQDGVGASPHFPSPASQALCVTLNIFHQQPQTAARAVSPDSMHKCLKDRTAAREGRKWIFHSIRSGFHCISSRAHRTVTAHPNEHSRRKIIYNLIALVNYAYFIIQGRYGRCFRISLSPLLAWLVVGWLSVGEDSGNEPKGFPR